MEKLNNNEIKKKLSKTTVDINLSDEWNELEILLDQKGNRRRWAFWILIPMGLASLIFIATLLIDNRMFKSSSIISTLEVHEKITDDFNSTNSTQAATDIEKITSNQDIKEVPNNEVDQKQNILSNESPFYNDELENDIVSFSTMAVESKLGIAPMHTKNDTNLVDRPTKENHVYNNGSYKSLGTIKNDFLHAAKRLNISLVKLPLKEHDIIDINSEPFIQTKPNHLLPKFLYLESSLSLVNDVVKSKTNGEYPNLLNENYNILSSFNFEGGNTKHISKNWLVGLGLKYNQYRSVFRGQILNETTNSEIQDSAQVYTNAVGGVIHTSGEVITKTKETLDIQQYSYVHNIGLSLNTRYYLHGPIYVGGKLSWMPLNWQSGKMIKMDNSVQPLNQLVSKMNKIDFDFNLGANIINLKRVMLDASITCRPNQSLFQIDDTSISSNNFGGSIRLSYMIK